MRRHSWLLAAVAALVASTAQTALAHPGHFGHDFTDGVLHPLFGLDHLLAMVAVGLLAARIGGRALWLLPVSFLAAMLGGGLLASLGVSLPFVETGIVASVVVFGALVALRRLLPLAACVGLVALFAMFHGYAHAAEMTAAGSYGAYAAGYLLSTAALLATGVLAALVASRHGSFAVVRACGATIAAASLLIVLG